MKDSAEKYDYYARDGLFRIFVTTFRKRGLFYAAYKTVKYLVEYIEGKLLFFKPRRLFQFENKELPYLYHEYNKTWTGERAIEIPIFISYLKGRANTRVLEIGNVLGHYTHVNHDIVDKYEGAAHVINQDIVDFKPKTKYDTIISISTMEHIGVDDEKDPEKVIRAIEVVLKYCLNKKGEFFISFPPNYNEALSKYIEKKDCQKYFFKKIDRKRNLWEQCSYEDIRFLRGSPQMGLVLAKINKA